MSSPLLATKFYIPPSTPDRVNRLIQHAIAHNQEWENPNHCAYAWMVKSRLDMTQNLLKDADEALTAAEGWLARGQVLPTLRAAIEQERVCYWLATGSLPLAQAWLQSKSISPLPKNAPFSEIDDVYAFAAARIHLAVGSPTAALDLLEPLIESARQGSRLNALIEALVLQACASAGTTAGVTALREALSLGLPRGFRQAFLADLTCLVDTLLTCQKFPEIRGLPGFTDLLDALPPPAPVHSLDSPLTAREIEILSWVAAGLSNPEIGARLYISAGTVKAHTAAIYRKLDVANRAEAISKAKDLGLL